MSDKNTHHEADHIAIRVSNLSKRYEIYDTPRDRLKQFVAPRLQRLAGQSPGQYFREFWALKDVSLEVKKGETVGIIGRNGSGKSTLLQILCGTLAQSSGSVRVSGRVAALLELGAGFNPEFTGRENIFMNAAILGLTTAQTEACFEQIVTFADIGDHLEQPVKTYSSGMYMRLAFSIAIAVEPDILIVDEALSVGDIAFQNKCMARIRKMSESGATILFVSHDLSTTQVICNRVIWLDQGRMVMAGDPVQVSREYYIASLGTAADAMPKEDIIAQQDTGLARFTEVRVANWSGQALPQFTVGDQVTIRFALAALAALEPTVLAISIYRADGDWLIGQSSREAAVVWPACREGEAVTGHITLDALCLAPGDYRIALGAYSQDLAICYGMTGILPGFTVQADFATWGKFIHPISWHQTTAD